MSAPEPMTPPDCDLRGYEYMPLIGQRLFGSDFYTLALQNPRAGLAGMKLWWEAWQQCPAGSLPSDDMALCRLADFGTDMKAWARARQVALHGFVTCSDGRLYHPLIAKQALLAFEKRAKGRERKAKWRASKDGDGTQGPSGVPQDDTETGTGRDEERDGDGTVPERAYRTGQDGTEERKKERGEAKASLVRSPRSRAARTDESFAQFYAAYPRKNGPDDALKAWRSVIKAGVTADEIMAGLHRHTFNADSRFVPLPGSWLRAGRWKDEPMPLQFGPSETASERRIREQREHLHRLVHGDEDEPPIIDLLPDRIMLQ